MVIESCLSPCSSLLSSIYLDNSSELYSMWKSRGYWFESDCSPDTGSCSSNGKSAWRKQNVWLTVVVSRCRSTSEEIWGRSVHYGAKRSKLEVAIETGPDLLQQRRDSLSDQRTRTVWLTSSIQNSRNGKVFVNVTMVAVASGNGVTLSRSGHLCLEHVLVISWYDNALVCVLGLTQFIKAYRHYL